MSGKSRSLPFNKLLDTYFLNDRFRLSIQPVDATQSLFIPLPTTKPNKCKTGHSAESQCQLLENQPQAIGL